MSNIELSKHYQSLDKIRQEIADICVKIDELTLYFNTYSVPSDNILWLQYHHMKEYHNTLKTRAMRLERENIILNQSNNNGWISIFDMDNPPPKNEFVLVTDGFDVTTSRIETFFEDGEWLVAFENPDITHWQPLPQPPKE